MKRCQLMLVVFLFGVSTAFTQVTSKQTPTPPSTQGPVLKGIVLDDQSRPLTGASVMIKKKPDSSLVKISVSDKEGNFIFEGVDPGSYFLHISFVGYAPFYSDPIELSSTLQMALPPIKLEKNSGNLKAVEVVAKKPLVEIKADKTVLNVEGSINAVGQDALELLRKSPGVMVDKDDNLSLSGKNGVQVYVDGRPTPLSGSDLAAYLKTLQSSSIEAIEIITSPSAKYDAAGNAGIINIKLKKNKAYGTNGSVNAGFNQGIYPKYIGGLSLNHRNKYINFYGNYNYNNSKNESWMTIYRVQLDTLFDGSTVNQFRNQSHNFKAGVDYSINNKNTIGVMFNGNYADISFTNNSRTPISYVPTGEVVKILVAQNSSEGYRNSTNFNVNYRYADTTGKELNVDGDYGAYRLMTDQLQPNVYLDPVNGNVISTKVYNMLSPSDINIYSVKADYQQNLGKGKLGVGGKLSYVNSINDFQRFDVLRSVKKMDTLRSNAFEYKENVNAVYLNYDKAYKGFIVQIGFRVENTNIEGYSTGFRQDGTGYMRYDSVFTRHYTDLFPSAGITFNKKPTSQIGIRYSRRIDRPAYQDLNPFEFKIDEYTFQKGNTNLRPQYTNSISVTHAYKYKLNTVLTYSHVKDVFTSLVDTAEKSKAFLSKSNLATQDIISLNVSYPLQIKWFSAFVNLNSYYTKYQADFGPGRTVDLDVFAMNVYLQNTFNLGKGWSGELTGYYNSPSIWQGTFKSKEMYGVDAGILKTLFKGKATAKVSVSDIFKTMQWGGTSEFSGQYINNRGGWESRQLRLNFTYRFGNTQVKAARQRKTGAEEENKRVGSQSTGVN
ncbi:outer membrane beta-barrel protein [Flavitalea antarctica]